MHSNSGPRLCIELRLFAGGLQFGNKCYLPSGGEREIVGKPTMESDIGRFYVRTVNVIYQSLKRLTKLVLGGYQIIVQCCHHREL